jgi:hypothetical protein
VRWPHAKSTLIYNPFIVNMKAVPVAAMLLLAAALHARAQGGALERARAELEDAEIAYEKSRYPYPRCDSPSDDFDGFVRKQATELDVTDFTLTHTPGSDAGPASPFRITRMQLHGLGEFGDLQSLLRRIASLGQIRPLDFETVQLRAGSGRNVSLDGTVTMACVDAGSHTLEVAIPEGGTPAELELARYRDRAQQLRAAAAAAKQLEERLQPRRLADALLVLADVWGQSAVGVSELRYTAPALTLQGVVLGASAKAAVEGSLREPRFELTRLDWSPDGDCHAFAASARLTADAASAGDALPMNMFLGRDAAPCGPPSTPATSVAKRGSGPLTIHLRNADVSALFVVLNDLSPADGFILAPDVAGRVNVELDGVTVDEALAALHAAGVAFATPGPLHRICRIACAEPGVKPSRKYEGEPLALALANADILDILRVLQAVSGLELYAPPGLHGNVTAYVTEAPWDAVFETLLAAFGRTYALDGNRVYIGDRTAAVPLDKLVVPTTPSPRSLLERDPQKIAAADFRLAGVAETNGTWRAYGRVLGSPKLVFVAAPGAQLLDASVATVAAGRVTLRTTAGSDVVVTLP